MIHDRHRAVRTGRWAEALCFAVPRLKGYRILLRGFRTPVGEVDIVARQGRILTVIEVKARATKEGGANSIGDRQRQRITRATEYLTATLPGAQNTDIRFDAMLVVPWRLPIHIMNAWGR